MFENEESENCVFVDFQVMRYAPLVLDILQLLYVNTTEKITEKMEMEFLKIYHKTLNEVIMKNNSFNAKTPTFEEVVTAYKEYKYFGIIQAILKVPLNRLDKDVTKKMTSTSEDLNDFIIGNGKIKVVLDTMDTNENYQSNMKFLIENLLSLK